MLTHADNERLTRIGPGTPMGELFRRYWHPIAASAQLDENPVRPVRILGEDLVLYRDGQGRVGLVAERCAHRRVKLRYGIPENEGLRCPYHGWMFDATGQCIEQPAEPAGSQFKDKVKITAYPVEELAGLVFAYLGPNPAPLLPRWDRLVWDNVFRCIEISDIPCNWLQCMENSPDTLHTAWLHGRFFQHWMARQGIPESDPKHRLAKGWMTPIGEVSFEVTDYGMIRRREVNGDKTGEHWTVGQPMMFPHVGCVSGSGTDAIVWRVPVDDTHTLQYHMFVLTPGNGNGFKVPKQKVVPYWNESIIDPAGGYRNLDTVSAQDQMAWLEQGEIVDRTQERLGVTDIGVIRYRQLLEKQIQVMASGADPMNVFRDPAQNRSIALPRVQHHYAPRGFNKDGSYQRGGTTARFSQAMPQALKDEIEDLFERAASAQPA
jgi:5,5'-dehydrodivanillate O-demethylase oxygenase subunit